MQRFRYCCPRLPFPSKHHIRHPRLKREPPDLMRADPHDLLQGQRLTRKRLAVDLVEGDDGAFRHSGQEQLQCLLRWFV